MSPLPRIFSGIRGFSAVFCADVALACRRSVDAAANGRCLCERTRQRTDDRATGGGVVPSTTDTQADHSRRLSSAEERFQ